MLVIARSRYYLLAIFCKYFFYICYSSIVRIYNTYIFQILNILSNFVQLCL